MNERKQYSDEHLNAFIDDQLSNTEKADILDAIRHDHELSQRVCELQKIHNLVQLSYESINVPKHHQGKEEPQEKNQFKWVAAASILLLIGSVTGWLSHQALDKNNISEIAQLTQYNAIANKAKSWKVMLHVSTANPTRLNLVLDEAETLLKEYADTPNKLELEILANSNGMALVTENGKNYSKRLEALQNQYHNLAVVACGETLKRLRSKQKDIQLLPKTNVVSSALNQIVKRQKEGWSYIRI